MRTLVSCLAWLHQRLNWALLGIAGLVLIGGIAEPLIATLVQGEAWTWAPLIAFLKEWALVIAVGAVFLFVLWIATGVAHRYEKGRAAFRLAKAARDLASPNEIASARVFAEEGNSENSSNRRPWKNTYVPLPLVSYDEVKRAGFYTPETVSDEEFAKLLDQNDSVLLIGIPTSGKTRKIFEVLRTYLPDREVIVPHRGNALRSDLPPEAKRYLRRNKVVVVLDDLDRYADKGGALQTLLQGIRNAAKGCAIVGTCRDGAKLEIARDRRSDGTLIQGSQISLVYQQFRWHRYFVRPPDKEQYRQIAQGAGIDLANVDLDSFGAPGDLLLQEGKEAMKARFEDDLSSTEKDVLHAAQLLDVGTIVPTHQRLCIVTQVLYGRNVNVMGSLRDALQRLGNYGFISPPSHQDPILLEQAYTSLDVETDRIVVPYRPSSSVDGDLASLVGLLFDTQDTDGLVELGRGFYRHKKYTKAFESYDCAVKVDPSDSMAWYNRGVALEGLGRLEEALKSFSHAIKQDPSDSVAWYNRGVALEKLGRPKEALRSYNHACEVDPDYCDQST